jgi:hypothetical protein
MKMKIMIMAVLVLGACTPEDEKLKDYCFGITDASDSIIALREQGVQKDAVLGLITNSEIAKDPVLLAYVKRNIAFAYQYPGMPLEIYRNEVLNHCLASAR